MIFKKNVLPVLCALFVMSGCVMNKNDSQNNVAISAIGTVLVQPDMVSFSIGFSHIAPTTKQAKEVVDNKLDEVMRILIDEDIGEEKIKTDGLSYEVAADWINGRYTPTGQRASQNISVTINNIVENPQKLPRILDRLSELDSVIVQNLRFDTENKAELFKESRKLAFEKSKEKAEQYAALAGRKLGRVLSISEVHGRDILYKTMQSNVAYDSAVTERAAAVVPTGEQEVTSEVNVVFLLK